MHRIKFIFINKKSTLQLLSFVYLFVLIFCIVACNKKEKDATNENVVTKEISAQEKTIQEKSQLCILPGTEINLGLLGEHQTVILEFELKNCTIEDLTIEEIFLNCNCGKFLNAPQDHILKPDEVFVLKLELYANKLGFGEFERYINIDLGDDKVESITINGEVYANFEVAPGRVIDLGTLSDPADEWQQKIIVKGINFLAEKMIFAEKVESKFFNVNIQQLSDNVTQLNIISKANLPYGRRFRGIISIPIKEPADQPNLILNVRGAVGTTISFKPLRLIFDKNDFIESETAIKKVRFGHTLEEKNINAEAIDDHVEDEQGKMLIASIVQDTPLINWVKLNEFLEFNCPAGVRVDKVLFDEGLLLNIVVDKTAFDENKRLEIIPYRDDNQYKKIRLFYRD